MLNWSQRIVRWTKGQSCVGFSGTLGWCDKWARLSAVSDNRRWNLGFRVGSHNQKTDFRVAHFPVTLTKEGPNEQIKSKIHALIFFIQRELFKRSLCHPDRLRIKHFTYSWVSEKQRCVRSPWNCKHVVPSPRQWAKSHIICCEGMFGSLSYHNASPRTVQPWLSSVWFLFISQAQNPPHRTTFLDSWKRPGSCDEGFEHLK